MDSGLIMVFAGKYLADNGYETITEIDLQKYMKDSDEVGFNIPLPECRKALENLSLGGFLEVLEFKTAKIYTYKGGKPVKKIEYKYFQEESIGNTLPMWSNNCGLQAEI